MNNNSLNALIGYTGFVGSNLIHNNFDIFKTWDLYRSSNISNIKNKEYNIVICAGVPANKWYANENCFEDLDNINCLLNNLREVKHINTLIVISTIDVYDFKNIKEHEFFDEQSTICFSNEAYGKNRLYFEVKCRVLNNVSDVKIIRLPALYGFGLKKNFLYDILHLVPNVLTESAYNSILNDIRNSNTVVNFENVFIDSYNKSSVDLNYHLNSNYSNLLESILESVGRTSLQFTNPNSEFQFFNLNNLMNIIKFVLVNNIPLYNIATEPIKAKDICENLRFGHGESRPIVKYRMKSIYHESGFLQSKFQELQDINKFLKEEGLM